MSLMNWNEHFVTGIEIIDSQHLGLVKMINDSAPILAQAYKRYPAHADKLLDQLTDYAIFHFKNTEQRNFCAFRPCAKTPKNVAQSLHKIPRMLLPNVAKFSQLPCWH